MEPSDDAVEFSDGERVVIVRWAALLFFPLLRVVEVEKGSKDEKG